jgi:hypothetical protein
MNSTKTVNVTINDVVFTIDVDLAIKAGIAKPATTHKVGNYYRNTMYPDSVYILTCHNYHPSRMSLVKLAGRNNNNVGRRVRSAFVFDSECLSQTEFDYVACGMPLEQIDNPLVK